MTDALYSRCPLPPHPSHIRLLRLHASSDPSTPLSGTIFATTFEASCASYEALSYCWGDDARPETISLHVWNRETHSDHSHTDENTIPIHAPITRSLAEALADLRFPFSDRLLWADALCIHQADNGEKSIQVRQMYDVYANSRRTLVYLGRGGSKGMQAAIAHRDYLRAINAGSDKCLDFTQAANTGTLVTWDPAVGVVRAGKGAPARGCLDYRTMATLPDTDGDVLFVHHPDIIDSWRCILERPWTTRAWTTQEFVAGPDVLMQLGQGEVTLALDDLTNLVRYMRFDLTKKRSESSSTSDSDPKLGGLFYVQLPTSSTVASKVFRMINIRLLMREGGETLSFGEALLTVKGDGLATVLDTRDARDVLWSLLPFSGQKAVEELQPNYDLSIDEVYRRFSIHIVTDKDGPFPMLLNLPLQRQNGTPSWKLSEALEAGSWRFYYEQISDSDVGVWATANEQGTELTVRGALVDRIDRLVEPDKIKEQFPTTGQGCDTIWFDIVYINTHEAASWPGLYVLPGESREEAAFKFFRGITPWVQSDRKQPVFNASWEQYVYLWFVAQTDLRRTAAAQMVTRPGESSLLPGHDLVDSEFFKLVRSKGWPMEMVRHYLRSDASEPSGFPPPGELTTKAACRAALKIFQSTAMAYAGPWTTQWEGKTVGMTSRGHLCNVDEEARVGDWIGMTVNSATAVTLREGPGGAYSLVGWAYAHGLLEGMEMYGYAEEEIRLC
jgi:hypothetical protein